MKIKSTKNTITFEFPKTNNLDKGGYGAIGGGTEHIIHIPKKTNNLEGLEEVLKKARGEQNIVGDLIIQDYILKREKALKCKVAEENGKFCELRLKNQREEIEGKVEGMKENCVLEVVGNTSAGYNQTLKEVLKIIKTLK